MTGAGRRRKGHGFERAVALRYRSAGFPAAVTARAVSGGLQAGADVLGLPWPVECKARKRFSVSEAADYTERGHVVHVRLDRRPEVVVVPLAVWERLIRPLATDPAKSTSYEDQAGSTVLNDRHNGGSNATQHQGNTVVSENSARD